MILEPRSALDATFGTSSAVIGFRSDRAVLRERADFGSVLLTAAVDGTAIAASASSAAGLDLPIGPGPTKASSESTAIWLSPRSWLILCGVEDEARLVDRLNKAFPDKLLHTVGFADQLCLFELSGVASLDLLTEGSFLSLEPRGLPVGNAKRTLIAQVVTVVIRTSGTSWLLAVERSRARYFAGWLIAAAASPERSESSYVYIPSAQ
jgi:sarcosine oxidase subunit gamma